jgi:hypothetical protein
MNGAPIEQADLFEEVILPRFEEHRADWLERARGVAVELCQRFGEITIDNVRAECPPPENADPRVMGAVMRPPVFEIVRYQKSVRSTCHKRPVAVFRLRGRG